MSDRVTLQRGAIGVLLLASLALSACVTQGEARSRPVTTRPAVASVPDLEGLRLREARHRLRHVGLRLGAVDEKPTRRHRQGTVLGQVPGPHATLELGSTVDLLVAVERQPARIMVPDLEGKPLARARARLSRRGLRLGTVSHEVSRHAAPGSVIAQFPDHGAEVRPESRVDLVVARAPEAAKRRTRVPDLAGLKVKAAAKALKRADLRLGAVRERRVEKGRARDGAVIRQYPAAAERARRGTAVAIVVARVAPDDEPSRLTDVPAVTGLPLDEARGELRRAKLRLGKVTRETVRGHRPGRVIVQRPRPGTAVRPGTRIDLVTARAPEPASGLRTVPALSGLSAGEADAKLRRAGLRLGGITFARNGGELHAIVKQSPAAGTRVKAKSRVAVVVVEPRD